MIKERLGHSLARDVNQASAGFGDEVADELRIIRRPE